MVDAKEGVVTMCIVQGLFIVGKLVSGGPKLLEPRVWTVFEEQQRSKEKQLLWLLPDGSQTTINTGVPLTEEKIMLKPLPGVPMFCLIGGDSVTYPLTEDKMGIVNLYSKVTGPDAYKPRQPVNRMETGMSGGEGAEITLIKPLMGPRMVPPNKDLN